MALESSEVRVAGTGNLYVAPLGTAIPADVGTSLSHNVGWIDLGYANEDGVAFSFGREINDVMAWQSYDPLRKIVTRVPKTVGSTLLQTNRHVIQLAFGGGTFTETSTDKFRYDPPAESEVDERMFAVEFVDDDYTYRVVYRKALNEGGIEFTWVRENAVQYPITMSILAADAGAKPFSIYSNDPNFGDVLDAAS